MALEDLEDFLTKRNVLCQNRCNFCIKDVRTRTKKLTEDEQAIRVDEAVLLCSGCGLTEPIEFKNVAGDF